MRTKKEIKAKHKQSKIVKHKSVLCESTDLAHTKFEKSMNIKYTADTQGWYKKIEAIAHKDSRWASNLVGKCVYSLEYFDGDLVIQLNLAKQTLQIPLYALGDLKTLANLLDYFNQGKVFTKQKLKVKKNGK